MRGFPISSACYPGPAGKDKGIRNRIRQLQRETGPDTGPDTFSIPAEDQLNCVSNVTEVFDGS